MLKLLNTKLLIAILAALSAIASAAIYHGMKRPRPPRSLSSSNATPKNEEGR